MFGAMKAGKQEKNGKSANKANESKIMRKQTAPGIHPVIRMAEKNVLVIGSTHVVQMVGHTLFNGNQSSHVPNQSFFLRQGTRVTIDNQRAVRSRRGPNQSFFRKEDRRGEHIYRWVHVLSIEGQDVSYQNLYIREGTFREEAFMAGRVLAPPSGGVRPSISVAPETRRVPLLRPRGEGEEGQDILTPEQRSLNRLARGEWVTLEGDIKTKTPHLAMMVWRGKVYVAGNTDRLVPREVIGRVVLEKLRELIDEPEDQRLSKIREELRRNKNWKKKPEKEQMDEAIRLDGIRHGKKEKMYRKLELISDGRYHAEKYQDNGIMIAIRNAILNPEENIVLCSENQVAPSLEKQEPIHGEMLILDMLYEEYKRRGEREMGTLRKRLRKVFAGGNLQDCIFCHWAFDIFNRVIGSQIGVMVVSSGTHGQIPGSWRIPRWMTEEAGAMRMLVKRIDRLNKDMGITEEREYCSEIEYNGGYNIINREGHLVLTYSNSVPMRNTMLPESDSE